MYLTWEMYMYPASVKKKTKNAISIVFNIQLMQILHQRQTRPGNIKNMQQMIEGLQ